jgi:L-ascorbate metabolism protein UlaG (beta-lactamase superfamily)
MMKEILETKVGKKELAFFFLGQNSFLLKDSTNILIAIDPYFSRHPKIKYVHKEPPMDAEEFKVDYVFCTHDHLDHTDPTTLSKIAEASPKALFFGPAPSCKRMRTAGIPQNRIYKLEANSTIKIAEVSVTAISSLVGNENKPAWNPWEEKWTDHYGYIFDFGFVRVYNMGDSSPEMAKNPKQVLNPVVKLKPDIIILPIIGDYPERKPTDALAFTKILEPKIVIPCHYSCFKTSKSEWPRTINPEVFASLFKEIPDIKPIIIDYKGKYIYKA